jgi:hypothetical protein
MEFAALVMEDVTDVERSTYARTVDMFPECPRCTG